MSTHPFLTFPPPPSPHIFTFLPSPQPMHIDGDGHILVKLSDVYYAGSIVIVGFGLLVGLPIALLFLQAYPRLKAIGRSYAVLIVPDLAWLVTLWASSLYNMKMGSLQRGLPCKLSAFGSTASLASLHLGTMVMAYANLR
jgi:hypothetical protein